MVIGLVGAGVDEPHQVQWAILSLVCLAIAAYGSRKEHEAIRLPWKYPHELHNPMLVKGKYQW